MKNIIIILIVLFAFSGFIVAEQNSKIDTTGLVAYYPFNGDANDCSGHWHDGTVYGAVLCPDRFGNPSSAYMFDGINDYIEVPYAAELNPTQYITISAWVKADTWGSYDYSNSIIDTEHPGEWIGYGLRGGAGLASFFVSNGSWQVIKSAPGTISSGFWYHLASRYDGSSVKLYINGSEIASMACSGSLVPSDMPLRIGTNNSALRFFDGVIDDIRIYNRALSQLEIESLYDGPPSVELIFPENGASINIPQFPNFIWHKADSAEFYRFQLSMDPLFSTESMIEDFTLIDTSTICVSPPDNTGPYWWRVINYYGDRVGVSSFNKFYIGIPQLCFPPKDTSFSNTNTLKFIWCAIDSASYYHLWVASDSNFININVNHSLYDTSYTPFLNFADGHYFWKVKAYGITSLEQYESETRHFCTNYYGGVLGNPGEEFKNELKLGRPYPNPASVNSMISWKLVKPTNIELGIYNISGQLIYNIVSGLQDAGDHSMLWKLCDQNGNKVSNGIYFVRLTAGSNNKTNKLVIIR